MSIESYEFGAIEIGVSFTYDQQFYRKASASTATLLQRASGIEPTQSVEQPFKKSSIVSVMSRPSNGFGSFGFLIGELRLQQSCKEVESDRVPTNNRLMRPPGASTTQPLRSILHKLDQHA